MSPEDQQAILPQAMHEGFAHEFISFMRSLMLKQQQDTVGAASLASPFDKRAMWNQLTLPSFAPLLSEPPHAVVCQQFLIYEYAAALWEDLSRCWGSEEFGQLTKTREHVWWVQLDRLDQYPCIQELTERLTALPHELNRRCGLKLCEVLPNSMAVFAYTKGTMTPTLPESSSTAALVCALSITGPDAECSSTLHVTPLPSQGKAENSTAAQFQSRGTDLLLYDCSKVGLTIPQSQTSSHDVKFIVKVILHSKD